MNEAKRNMKNATIKTAEKSTNVIVEPITKNPGENNRQKSANLYNKRKGDGECKRKEK